MAIRTVVTRGFGNGTFNGTIGDVVTRGYAIGAANYLVTCTLVNRNGSSLPSLTAISWAWFDAVDPVNYVSPTDTGQVETTDASGVISIDLPNTGLTTGQEGTLVLRSDDGVSLGAYNLEVSE